MASSFVSTRVPKHMLFHKHTLSDNNVNRQGRQAGDARFSPSLLSSSPCFSLHLGFKRRRGDAATALGVRVIEPPCPLDGVAVEPVSAEPDAITRVDHFRRRRHTPGAAKWGGVAGRGGGGRSSEGAPEHEVRAQVPWQRSRHRAPGPTAAIRPPRRPRPRPRPNLSLPPASASVASLWPKPLLANSIVTVL
jgi:hypothetical protein